MRPILQTLPTGGTENGIHSYLARLGCARRAFLSEQERQLKDPSILEGTQATLVGTIFHAFAALYYRRKNFRNENVSAVQFTQTGGETLDVPEIARLEAERLFRAYRVAFSQDELGEVLAVEKSYETILFGVPYSMRIDLEVKIGAREARKLEEQFPNLSGITPGFYLVDHKTAAQRSPVESWFYDLQATAYQLAHPDTKKVKGFIFNLVYKTKEVGFDRILVPYPTEIQQDVLKNVLFQSSELREQSVRCGTPKANPSLCFLPITREPCPFLLNGQCDRR